MKGAVDAARGPSTPSDGGLAPDTLRAARALGLTAAGAGLAFVLSISFFATSAGAPGAIWTLLSSPFVAWLALRLLPVSILVVWPIAWWCVGRARELPSLLAVSVLVAVELALLAPVAPLAAWALVHPTAYLGLLLCARAFPRRTSVAAVA